MTSTLLRQVEEQNTINYISIEFIYPKAIVYNIYISNWFGHQNIREGVKVPKCLSILSRRIVQTENQFITLTAISFAYIGLASLDCNISGLQEVVLPEASKWW